MSTAAVIAGVLLALAVLFWIGRRIPPRPFPPLSLPGQSPATFRLPAGLPAPVERFYRALYGEEAPVITAAVLSGRCMMRPAGPFFFPGRFRLTHIAGHAYRHYIEMTFFGIPVIKANEYYRDGHGRMDITFIGADQGPKIDQAANLALWAEAAYFPSLYLTDPRASWEPLDDDTAVLAVPFDGAPQRFVVRFHPVTHLVEWTESMRYHASGSPQKTLWLNHSLASEVRDGQPYPRRGEVIWMDDGKPWFILDVEEAVFNADLAEYIRATGP